MKYGKWIAFTDQFPPSSFRLDMPKCITTDMVLVTNNIKSRDAMGRMSHIWFAAPILTETGEVVAFSESEEKIRFLTHWYAIDLKNPKVRESNRKPASEVTK